MEEAMLPRWFLQVLPTADVLLALLKKCNPPVDKGFHFLETHLENEMLCKGWNIDLRKLIHCRVCTF